MHISKGRWCKLSDTEVNNNITDIGTKSLQEGGTIKGSIPVDLAADEAVKIYATHENGILIGKSSKDDPVGGTFAISELWPGQWTVTVEQSETEVLKKVVRVEGVETVTCDFVTE